MLCAHLVDNDNKLQSYLYYGTAIPWFGTRSIVAREKKKNSKKIKKKPGHTDYATRELS